MVFGPVKGTKLLWISEAGFWFELCTFWSSVHFSEECRRKSKRVPTCCRNCSLAEHIHGQWGWGSILYIYYTFSYFYVWSSSVSFLNFLVFIVWILWAEASQKKLIIFLWKTVLKQMTPHLKAKQMLFQIVLK